MVSALTMCTAPYKTALMKSLGQIKRDEMEDLCDIGDGFTLALKLLEKDARQGGHLFVISAGDFRCSSDLSKVNTTIHVIAIGALTNTENLNRMLHHNGTHLDFRIKEDLKGISTLMHHLSSHQISPPIATIQARLDPLPNVAIKSCQPGSLNPTDRIESVTIGTARLNSLTKLISRH